MSGSVFYDWDSSVVACTPADAYDWNAIFNDAVWLHISGITPAISQLAAEATLTTVKKAGESGVQVSCDLNFRKKLWRRETGTPPGELAERTIEETFAKLIVYINQFIPQSKAHIFYQNYVQ